VSLAFLELAIFRQVLLVSWRIYEFYWSVVVNKLCQDFRSG